MGRNKNRKYESPDDTPTQTATDEFRFVIPEAVHRKVMYWIDKASPNEVSGFGSLDFDEATSTFTVREAILLKQEVSGGSTELDENAINKAMFLMKDEPNALKWHWHSHPTFGTFWSGTDMNLIRQLGQRGWIVATVLNCKRESRTAFLTSVEVMGRPHDIFVDEIPFAVKSIPDKASQAVYDKEFDANVKVKKWAALQPYTPPGYDKPGSLWRPYEQPTKKSEMWSREADEERFEERHHRPSKQKLTPQFIPDKAYDCWGYAKVGDLTIYNPLHDEDVKDKGDQAIFVMIAEMSPEAIEFLEKCDAKFANAVKRYVIDLTSNAEVYSEMGNM